MRPKIIIDTDPGQDDAVAILLALVSPEEIEVLGIVAIAGNVPLERPTGRPMSTISGRPMPTASTSCPPSASPACPDGARQALVCRPAPDPQRVAVVVLLGAERGCRLVAGAPRPTSAGAALDLGRADQVGGLDHARPCLLQRGMLAELGAAHPWRRYGSRRRPR
jgi:hypothetical protein